MRQFDVIFTTLTFVAVGLFAVLNATNVDKLATSFTTNSVNYVKGIATIGSTGAPVG